MKKILFLAPLALLTISALANIIMAANVSDVGLRIHEYERKTAIIQARSDEMLAELASRQSLGELKKWAIAAGFVAQGKVRSVDPQSLKLAAVPGL